MDPYQETDWAPETSKRILAQGRGARKCPPRGAVMGLIVDPNPQAYNPRAGEMARDRADTMRPGERA